MHEGRSARIRFVGGALVALLLAFVWPQSASAQVGYDPTKKLVTLGAVVSDSSGTASGSFTLPDDTTGGFEVIASGVDPSDQPRSVLADVTNQAALGARHDLELASGRVAIELAAVSGPGGSLVSVSASGFKANSQVSFSVRYTLPSSGSGGSGGSLPLTGSNIGLLIAVALAALLVGTAMLGGSKVRQDR